MKRLPEILIILLALLVGRGCTEIVDIELDSTYARLVVFGTITTDSIAHSVELTRTTDYFYNETPPAVSDAIVSISFNDSVIFLQENQESPGKYYLPAPMKGIPGTTYHLEITGVDIDEDGEEETYGASAVMPTFSKADSIGLLRFFSSPISGYQVLLYSADPPERNWYKYRISVNEKLLDPRLSDYTVQPDDFVNNNYIFGLPIGFLSDDDEDEQLLPGDIVQLEINSISETYYNFIVEAQGEIFGNNPLFSGPPANVSTNIDNNAVGIFTAYTVDRVEALVRPPFVQ